MKRLGIQPRTPASHTLFSNYCTNILFNKKQLLLWPLYTIAQKKNPKTCFKQGAGKEGDSREQGWSYDGATFIISQNARVYQKIFIITHHFLRKLNFFEKIGTSNEWYCRKRCWCSTSTIKTRTRNSRTGGSVRVNACLPFSYRPKMVL